MKIRLIQPAHLDEDGKPIKFTKLFLPTLALPTIAALTPKGIDVGITDEYVGDIDFDEDADLVGVTAHTSQAPRAYQIAAEFRKRGRRTIIGGIHATACPEEALQHFDSVLVGEAEDIWEQVLNDVKFGNVKRIYKAPERPDLSRLAIPRFDLLDFNNYIIPPFAKTPLIPIQSTRGCPYACDFCSVTPFLGNKIRKKPVTHVIKEIETIRPSRILFADDNIGADPHHARSLFEALKPLRIRWACQMSTTIIQHPELITLAAKAGCHETLIGVESLNANTLKAVNKGFNKVDQYEELFSRLKDVGILAQASFVFGLDGDNVDSLRRTIDHVVNWDINYMYIFILTPLPGAKIYQQLKDKGRIVDEDWSLYDAIHPVIKFKEFSTDELMEIVWDAYQEFYSFNNIFKRVWRFKKQYTLFFPRDFAIEEIFFNFLIRKSVKMRKHPLTLGLIKDSKKT